MAARVRARAREEKQRCGEGKRKRGKREQGIGVQVQLQGVLLGVPGTSRRWQRRHPGSLHAGSFCLSEEDKAILQKAPWASGFSGNFENCTSFARFCDFHLFRTL
jgi:hypothetical protein